MNTPQDPPSQNLFTAVPKTVPPTPVFSVVPDV